MWPIPKISVQSVANCSAHIRPSNSNENHALEQEKKAQDEAISPVCFLNIDGDYNFSFL
jgi:hypothetical protein